LSIREGRRYAVVSTLLAVVTPSARAIACPGCALGARVRCAVLGEGFVLRLFLLSLPFLLVAAATFVSERRAATKDRESELPR